MADASCSTIGFAVLTAIFALLGWLLVICVPHPYAHVIAAASWLLAFVFAAATAALACND